MRIGNIQADGKLEIQADGSVLCTLTSDLALEEGKTYEIEDETQGRVYQFRVYAGRVDEKDLFKLPEQLQVQKTTEESLEELREENDMLSDALLEMADLSAQQDEKNAMLEDCILELAGLLSGE